MRPDLQKRCLYDVMLRKEPREREEAGQNEQQSGEVILSLYRKYLREVESRYEQIRERTVLSPELQLKMHKL